MSDLTDEEIIATRKLHGLDDDLFRENIEIGEYVRTKDGFIRKIVSITKTEQTENNPLEILWCDLDKPITIFKETSKTYIYALEKGCAEKLKHSKQLIELIEVGDILKIKEGNEVCYIGLEKDTTTVSYKDIKASIKKGECELLEILTKEQFSANCYKVGGEDE